MKLGTQFLALCGLVVGSATLTAQQSPAINLEGFHAPQVAVAPTASPALTGSETHGTLRYGKDRSETKRSWWSTATAGLLGTGDSIAQTGYDFQTNAAMPRRIVNWGRDGISPDGIVSTFIYMAAPALFPTTPMRGTYGAVLGDLGDDREWLPLNFDEWERLESSRSGFCDIEYFKSGDIAGQLVAVSHSNDLSLVNLILETDNAGSGQYLVVPVSGSDGGLWPRVAVDDQNTIHIIWTYQGLDGIPDGREGVMAYTRSTDLGSTWEPIVEFTNPRGQAVEGRLQTLTGGDSYQIDARGSNVAIWYMSTSVNLIQLHHPSYGDRSSGELWQPSVVANPSYTRRYGRHSDSDSTYWIDPKYAGTDTLGFVSDTVATPGSSFDLMVLEDGSVVGAFPEFPSFVTRFTIGGTPENFDTTQTTYLQGLISQGSMPAYTDRAFRFVRVDGQGEQLSTSLVPLPENVDNSGEFFQPRGFGDYLARWPQMAIGDNGDHFILFGSGQNGDWVTENVDGESVNFFRSHTFAVRSTNQGASWTIPQDLTPTGVDAQFASIGMWVDDEAHIVLQADQYPGDLVTSSDATNGLGLHPAVFSNIETMILPSSSFAPSSMRDAERIYGSSAVTNVSPNPVASTVTLSYTIGQTTDEARLALVDATGSTVLRFFEGRRVAGTYSLMTNLGGLPAGQYFVVLTVNGASTTMPVNVVR